MRMTAVPGSGTLRTSKACGGMEMEIGFIGLGNMGGPMSRRLVEAGHKLVVFDTQGDDGAADQARRGGRALAGRGRGSGRDGDGEPAVARHRLEVATGEDGLIARQPGEALRRSLDDRRGLAVKIAEVCKQRNIVQIDCPVSGGVGGAEKGTLAVMVSGPQADFDQIGPALEVFGKVFFMRRKPGMAQTMKLANNLLSATGMAASSEAIAMGVKAGLDPA